MVLVSPTGGRSPPPVAVDFSGSGFVVVRGVEVLTSPVGDDDGVHVADELGGAEDDVGLVDEAGGALLVGSVDEVGAVEEDAGADELVGVQPLAAVLVHPVPAAPA